MYLLFGRRDKFLQDKCFISKHICYISKNNSRFIFNLTTLIDGAKGNDGTRNIILTGIPKKGETRKSSI